MNRSDLFNEIIKKKSFLCVGLDTDINRIPAFLKDKEDPIFEFNKVIIDHTKDLAVAYKPNLAFYEALGPSGLESFRKTVAYIPENILTIADAKRGDIGNTSALYARSFFDFYNVDALTIAPYMGSDSVKPFLKYDNKWAIILGLTSNAGSADFQHIPNKENKPLYKTVLSTCSTYGTKDQIMFVVGATQASYFEEIRKIVPDHFLLVPGVGAQGGTVEDVCAYGMNEQVGLLINSSRSIIYASAEKDFGNAAYEQAKALQLKMEKLLLEKGLITS